jgi:hypothetical protein
MIQLSITVFTFVNIFVSVSGSYDCLLVVQKGCLHPEIESGSSDNKLI